MRINRNKLDRVLAERCKNLSDLCPTISASTLVRIRNGAEVTTKTVGKLAVALSVSVDRLIDTEEG